MMTMLIRLILILQLFSHSYASECHPHLNLNQPQFMIGYGSLISEKSKRNTIADVGPNIPVNIIGYERVWNMRAPQKKVTFLGVSKNPSKSFNGIIFSLTPEQIKSFDKREIGYCREKVSISDIKILSKHKMIKGDYWIYIPEEHCTSPYDKENYPIANYYQEIFLSGCQEIENKFHLKEYFQGCLKDMPID